MQWLDPVISTPDAGRVPQARSGLLRVVLPALALLLAFAACAAAVLNPASGPAPYFLAAGSAVLACLALRTGNRALRDSEARFHSIFDLAAVSINVTDKRGRYLIVNQRMVDMLGYTREELLQTDFQSITLAEDLERNLSLSQGVAERTLDHFRLEKRYRHKNGGIVHAEIFVRELNSAPGQSRRFICVALDVTERKRVEAQAAEHRRIRDFHFENTPLAVVEFTPDLHVRRWSKRAERVFGWTEAEALGQTAEQLGLIGPDQYEARRERVGRMLDGDLDHLSAVVPMCHRSGRRLWIEVHNSVTRDARGEVQTLISMALDVTESHEMLRMLNEGEARFRSIFHQAAVGIALLDADGRWLNVNQKLCEIVGYSIDELLEIDFQTITHPDDLDRDLHLASAVMDRTIDHYSMEKRYIRKDGSTIWIMLFVRRIDATADTPARFVSVIEDISERKAAEERVRILTVGLESQVAERTGQLREMIRAGQRRNEELSLITDMSGLLAAAGDADEAAQVVVRYLPSIFPLAEGALYLEGAVAGTFERRLHWGQGVQGPGTLSADDCWALRRGDLHHIEGEAGALFCAHLAPESQMHPHVCVPIQVLGKGVGIIELGWGRSADGWAPELALVKTVADKIGLAIGNLRLREELSRQALLDPLTGLHNRRWLENLLRRRVAEHTQEGGGFALLLIDVDHFKGINDRYGHEAGDRALQEVAGALVRCARAGESPARFGGEEFVLLLSTGAMDETLNAAERFRSSVQNLRVLARGAVLPPLTVSIGVALYPLHGLDEATLLESADAALYAAKRGGRNQVRMGDPSVTRSRRLVSLSATEARDGATGTGGP